MNRSATFRRASCAVVFAGSMAAAWLWSSPANPVSTDTAAASLPKPAPVGHAARNPISRRLSSHRSALARAQRWEMMPITEFPAALEALAADADHKDAIQALLKVWARRDSDGYTRFVLERGFRLVSRNSNRHLNLANPLLEHLVNANPNAAADLMDRLAGNHEELWGFVEIWRREAPEQMPYLLSRLGDRLSAQSPGRYHWQSSDPLALLPLVQQLQPGPTLNDLVRDGLFYYLDEEDADVTEAGTWLGQLPGELQSKVVTQLCRRQDPEVKPDRLRTVAAAMGVPEARLKLRR
jgi:hypothetical protein